MNTYIFKYHIIPGHWNGAGCSLTSSEEKHINITRNQYIVADSHYSDGIMSAMACEITGASIVCSAVCSGADIKKPIKALRQWPLWGKSTGHRWIPLTKGQWHVKMFPFDDFIIREASGLRASY